MIDFLKSRQMAFDTLSKGNRVFKISDSDKKDLPFLPEDSASEYEVFAVQTEYLNERKTADDISLYVVLKPDFPLTLPRIYLPQKEYDRFKYIPHVDVNSLICTYDTDTTRTNPDDPGGIVQTCLSRAVQIIENGVSNSNLLDFEEEFKAYWENKYDDEAEVKVDILALLDDPKLVTELSFIKLSKSISTYNYVIYQDNETGRRFLQYLKYRNITHTTESICYLGQLNFPAQQPLILNNEKVDRIVSQLSQSQQSTFRRYINKSETPKFILGYKVIYGRAFYLGWVHGKFDLNRKGYRKSTLDNYYVFKNLQKKDKIVRVSPQMFTPNQAVLRTDGIKQEGAERKFLIAGLGSVGSNLLFFLNSINNPEIRLVDNDSLTIDNLNRHFLGMNYLGLPKTNALKHYYLIKNPFQLISCKNESFIRTCLADINYVNSSDFIFCAIGRANIDQWIGRALQDGIISKPIFFLWVEPYLVGGHCLYLVPGGKSYDAFFDANNFYKNNIIENEEYLNGNTNLSMREAGCQTSYIPYSLNNVTAFLSAIYPKILHTIQNSPGKSFGITWMGDLEVLKRLGIKISQFAKDNAHESLIISE